MRKLNSYHSYLWPSAIQIRRARTSRLRNRTSKTTLGAEAAYLHNSLNELTRDENTGDTRGTLNFAFDKAGNRTLQTFGTGTQAITSAFTVGNDMNQLDRVAKGPMGAFEFHYDAEGNRISKFVNETDGRGEAEGTTGYGWDGKNRLVQVTLPDSTTVNYAYDYQNRLVSRTQGSEVRTFLFGSGNQVLEETLNGSRLALYGWGADGLATRTDANGQTLFYLKDALGSVMAIVDGGGAVVQSYEFSAYGESLSGKDAVNAFRFVGGAGGYTDDATGLVQFWNRWYDPQVGKWVSEDPIRQAGGVNVYMMSRNRITRMVDPSGLMGVFPRETPTPFPILEKKDYSRTTDDGTTIQWGSIFDQLFGMLKPNQQPNRVNVPPENGGGNGTVCSLPGNDKMLDYALKRKWDEDDNAQEPDYLNWYPKWWNGSADYKGE